jgi:23S rRNA G2445 N2-methylase RlmL
LLLSHLTGAIIANNLQSLIINKCELMTEQTNLEKKIKRHIYGKPQSVLIVFPAGLANAAQYEARFILDNLWFQNKFPSTLSISKNALRIDKIHMFAVMELMLRGQCFTDIRLIISEGKTVNMPAFKNKCDDISWDLYFDRAMEVKIKVDAGASPSLHEGAMKDILTDCLNGKVKRMVAGEEGDEAATLYVDAYQYQFVMSLSLAGAPLYKRGYRSILSDSAPLREDIAASCLQKALQFSLKNNPEFSVDALLIPFSGTGTFLFEYWMKRFQVTPGLLNRNYAIQAMPLFRSEHFKYLLKKAHEHCMIEQLKIADDYCMDTSEEANAALLKNIQNFKAVVEGHHLTWPCEDDATVIHQDDLLTMDITTAFKELSGNIFMPLNPPYGIRLGKKNDTVTFYKQIAHQIKKLAEKVKESDAHVSGFILCPDEDSWSAFCKTLNKVKLETYHMTQGGLDIRVTQFYI